MVWRGGEILSCWTGGKAKALGFLGECGGLHLHACRRQRQGGQLRAAKSAGFFSSSEANSRPRVVLQLRGLEAAPQRFCDVNKVLCVLRAAARAPVLQIASCWMLKCYFFLELASAASLIIGNIWHKPKLKGLLCSAERRQASKGSETVKLLKSELISTKSFESLIPQHCLHVE